VTIRKNLYEMLEMPIDLSDVVLKGSANSLTKKEEIISRFQIKFNHLKLRLNAYNDCLNDA